jgi:signal peptidase II
VVTSADPDATPVPPPRSQPRRRLRLFGLVAALVFAADVISKALVVAHLEDRAPVRLLGGGVYLVLARNSGAAFSVGTGATVLLTLVAVVVVVVILRAARRLYSMSWAVAMGLVLGGALGNLTDRMLRDPGGGRGHVVDWISLFADDGHVWPIFNLADSAIVCGAVLAAITAVRGIDLDGRKRTSGRQ